MPKVEGSDKPVWRDGKNSGVRFPTEWEQAQGMTIKPDRIEPPIPPEGEAK